MPDPVRTPGLFIGHGSPMNAIEDNAWSRGFRALAGLLPRPKAILAVSAHWYVPGTFLTGNDRPETIHDFGGFPQPLSEIQYPAPGAPELAKRVARLIGEERESVRTPASAYRGEIETPAWAQAFDADVAGALEQHDGDFLARSVLGDGGRMAHPTLDHYLPLLYAAGASDAQDAVRFPITGFDLSSLSMRAVLFG